MNNLIIFVTGMIILALQLLASRMMTPFFGVSLYIWSGILSTTLLCLAIGYVWGGRLAQRAFQAKQFQWLRCLYILLPALSAVYMAAIVFFYENFFAAMAEMDLLWGSLAACVVFMALPLIAMSALNPLLMAIYTIPALKAAKTSGSSQPVDAHAGWVFFISTMGSVIGVLVAAFLLIPYVGNRVGVWILALALSFLCLAAAWIQRKDLGSYASKLLLLSVFSLLLSLAGLVVWPHYQKQAMLYKGLEYTLLAEYPSFYGNIKVVDYRQSSTGSAPHDGGRLLFQDGLMQNNFSPDGFSKDDFSWVLEKLALGYVPKAKQALVLGMAAGVIPMRMQQRGIETDIVEINPRMLPIAAANFNFKLGDSMRLFNEDARTFVRHCPKKYDLIFVDLFVGDAIPEHVVTAEFFADLRGCLQKNGGITINSFYTKSAPQGWRSLAKTVAQELPYTAFYRHPDRRDRDNHNFYIYASADPLPKPVFLTADVPDAMRPDLNEILNVPEMVDFTPDDPIYRDDYNPYSVLARQTQISMRRMAVDLFPPALLAN